MSHRISEAPLVEKNSFSEKDVFELSKEQMDQLIKDMTKAIEKNPHLYDIGKIIEIKKIPPKVKQEGLSGGSAWHIFFQGKRKGQPTKKHITSENLAHNLENVFQNGSEVVLIYDPTNTNHVNFVITSGDEWGKPYGKNMFVLSYEAIRQSMINDHIKRTQQKMETVIASPSPNKTKTKFSQFIKELFTFSDREEIED